MKAAEAIGYPEIRDLQDFTSVGGFSVRLFLLQN